MAPRKKTQKPSDETPEVTKEESAVPVSGDDTITAVPEDDTIPSGEDTPSPEDAAGEVIVDPQVPEAPETLTATDADSIELAEPGTDDTVAASGDDTLASEVADDTVVGDDNVTAAEDTAAPETPAPETPAPVAQPPVVVKRGGVIPMLLGGAAAAAIGYVVAMQVYGTGDVTARLDAQDSAIADLKAAIPAAPDTSALETATQDNAAAISDMRGRLDDLAGQLTTMTDRMTELEKAPLENGVSDAAIEAYEAELSRLQDAMATQRAEVEAMVTRAQEMNAQADAQTARTEARAALTAIISAFGSGDSYAEALEALKATGQQVPAALEENAAGIPTLASLRNDFPPAARNALAATRGAGNESVGDFFKTQLGIRSLEPKSGDDPDAVLSRAEAAVADNNLAAALDEIATLPEAAQAELSDWSAAARTRLTTVEAANGLMSDLNSN